LLFRLDPALIRPGRVDVKEYIGHCSQSQIEKLYKRFFLENENNDQFAKEFAEVVTKTRNPVSAAQIQAYFMLMEDCPHAEILRRHQSIWEST